MIKNRRKQSKKFHKAVHTQEGDGSSPSDLIHESSSLRRKVPDLCKIRDFSFIRLKKHA